MSHFRTMPSRCEYFGTSYGHFIMQYWQPMHWSSRCRTIPVFGILVVSEDRAAFETGGFEAMMARRRDRLLIRLPGRRRAGDQSDVAPGFVFIESIERMARADARLAAGAGVEIDGEGILLAAARLGRRDEVAIVASLRGKVRALMLLRKALDGRQPLLLGKQLVDEINFKQ